MYQVYVYKNRPDFRVFIDLLYGAGRNVDTDGDSNPVNSRSWTYLYIADRESDDPPVQILARQTDLNIFKVKSASEELETIAALYLFLYCGKSIVSGDRELDEKEIKYLKARYAIQLQRAGDAVWHQSSAERPYPNSSNE